MCLAQLLCSLCWVRCAWADQSEETKYGGGGLKEAGAETEREQNAAAMDSVKQICILNIKARKSPLVVAQNKNDRHENKHIMSPFYLLKVGCFVIFEWSVRSHILVSVLYQVLLIPILYINGTFNVLYSDVMKERIFCHSKNTTFQKRLMFYSTNNQNNSK